ncbi:borealin-2 [Genypterus blacodes]|uniref:borealin-2 n=1 Tax=Genypterus blacodes TaxID=154954 RepID=UPI003F76EEC7
MPERRTRQGGSAQNKQLIREMRQNRLTLFIQQFEKEAQERMNELEAKMDNMLTTVDKVFQVEVMKMPPSLQNTRIGDLISEEEMPPSDVSIAMRREVLDMQQPLRRAPSKRVKPTPPQTTAAKTSKGGKGKKKSRQLVGSASAGNLRGSLAATERTQSRLTKVIDQTPVTKPKLRSVSTGDLSCSLAGLAPHITITTAHGQAVCFSEETKDDINLDLLDDVAWCQIQKLTRLMEYLSKKNQSVCR